MGPELINTEVSHPLVLGLRHLKQRGNNTVGFYQMGHTCSIGPSLIKPLAGRETITTLYIGLHKMTRIIHIHMVSKDTNSTEVHTATDWSE